MRLRAIVFAAMGLVIASAAIAQERVLKVVAPWEIAGIDPVKTGYVFGRMQVAETLVGADETGRPTPALAQSWSLSEDRKTWSFKLRANARFHDNTPVTSEAVATSLNRARAGSGVLSRVPIETISASGDAVVIITKGPFAPLPAFLANYTSIVLAPSAYDEKGMVKAIIGSGPFKITSLTQPLKFEAERFDGWWGKAPAASRVSYLAVPQAETRSLMAESGEADLAFALAASSVERLKRNSRIAVHVVTVPRTRMIKLNAGSPFFDDLRERRAFSLALDRQGMAATILRNPAAAANQLLPPSLGAWHRENVAPVSRNIAEAKRLLAEAGWQPGTDGILVKDGTRFSVTLRTFASWPELPVIATAIQAQLKEVGIDMQVSVGNSSDIPAGHHDGSLHLGLMSRNFSLVPDPLGTLLEDYGPKGGDWGAMNWSSPELTKVLADLGAAFDDDTRRALQRRAGEILDAELPVVPISWFDLPVAASKRLANVKVDPFELSYNLSAITWAD